MNREPIYAALFQLLSAVPGVVTASRILRHWSDVPADSQPALFQVQKSEEADWRGMGLPTKWVCSVEIYLYARTSDKDAQTPSQVLNPIIDAIEAAMKPAPGQEQTLGGLVSHCRIQGKVETDEGVLGDQGVVIVPITLVTA